MKGEASAQGNCFSAIALRLKRALAVELDGSLAAYFGMSSTAWSERKRRGAFPVDKLCTLIGKRPDLNLNLNYLLTGESEQIDMASANGQAVPQAVQTRRQKLLDEIARLSTQLSVRQLLLVLMLMEEMTAGRTSISDPAEVYTIVRAAKAASRRGPDEAEAMPA